MFGISQVRELSPVDVATCAEAGTPGNRCRHPCCYLEVGFQSKADILTIAHGEYVPLTAVSKCNKVRVQKQTTRSPRQREQRRRHRDAECLMRCPSLGAGAGARHIALGRKSAVSSVKIGCRSNLMMPSQA
jgi:hypothetical protein